MSAAAALASKHDIEGAAATMPAVSFAYCGNVAGMPRYPEPVMDCGPDGAAPDRLIARAPVPSDQQQQAIAARDCPVQRSIDCPPGTIEAHSMKVDNAIRLDRSIAQAPIPVAVERRSRHRALVAHRSALSGMDPGGLRDDRGFGSCPYRIAADFVA
jgi:hypothetical protein